MYITCNFIKLVCLEMHFLHLISQCRTKLTLGISKGVKWFCISIFVDFLYCFYFLTLVQLNIDAMPISNFQPIRLLDPNYTPNAFIQL